MAKDIYHNTVKTALQKDDWTMTPDPLTLKIGGRSAYVDLGAEKLFAAEKKSQRIAVEVKSSVSPSPVKDLARDLGQYIMYCPRSRAPGRETDIISGDSAGCIC